MTKRARGSTLRTAGRAETQPQQHRWEMTNPSPFDLPMNSETKKNAAGWKCAAAVLVGVIIYTLLENWADLKGGYFEGYRNQTEAKP
jgi:hypothetical protein